MTSVTFVAVPAPGLGMLAFGEPGYSLFMTIPPRAPEPLDPTPTPPRPPVPQEPLPPTQTPPLPPVPAPPSPPVVDVPPAPGTRVG